MTLYDQWMHQSEYDLETAKAMLRTERYLYVLFCCQQALEKALKAVISAKGPDSFPPKIHQLSRLAELAEVDLSVEQSRFLREVSSFYLPSRYPEDVRMLSLTTSRKRSEDVLTKVEAMVEWLKSIQ
jgi:HEPN domain-containing protein